MSQMALAPHDPIHEVTSQFELSLMNQPMAGPGLRGQDHHFMTIPPAPPEMSTAMSARTGGREKPFGTAR